MNTWLTLLFALAGISAFSIPSFPESINVRTIVEKSVAANNRDWDAAPGYACFVREQHDHGTKTYDELMIDGSPYRRLVAINGRRLSPDQEAHEQQKMKQAIAARQQESSEARQRRISKYETDRKRDQMLMNQMTKAFTFKLAGKKKLDGRPVYLLKATPRPGYQPPTMQTKVLTGMRGRLWIDTKEFQWVKVEAEATRAVSIAGFLARVEPGTRFELERIPVGNGIWLTKHFSMKARAKIFFFITQTRQENDYYFDCHKQGSLEAEERLAANPPETLGLKKHS